MTCVWEGIIASLRSWGLITHSSPKDFVEHLKNRNVKTTHVFWNGEPLTERLMADNFTAIASMNSNKLNDGYQQLFLYLEKSLNRPKE